MDKDVASALDAIDKVNPFATYLDNNTLSHVGEWIDTGSYVLNAIISGSIIIFLVPYDFISATITS